MEKHLRLSLFSVGISAWLMTILMLMIMPSSSDCFKITVKCYLKLTGHANAITVDVVATDTVLMLKQKIKTQTNIEPIRQTVEYQAVEEPEELEDDNKLADYGIVKDSEVIMFVDYPLMMTNSSTNGFKIKVTTDKKIFTRFIFHKTNRIPVKITGTLTVKQLKKLIIAEGLETETKDRIKSDVHRLTLKYGTTDKVIVLNDSKAIKEYNGIREGAEIFLSIDEFQISVAYTKEKEVKEEGEKVKKEKEVKEETKKKESEREGEKKKKEEKKKESEREGEKKKKEEKKKESEREGEKKKKKEKKKESEREGEKKKKEEKKKESEREGEKKKKEEKKKESEKEGEKKKKGNEAKEEIKLTIWVNGTDTVQMLKQKIKNAIQIEPTRQSLTYRKPSADRMPQKHSECSIFWLENEKMLNAYGIVKDAIVYMEQN